MDDCGGGGGSNLEEALNADVRLSADGTERAAAAALDTRAPEVVAWYASSSGISGEMIGRGRSNRSDNGSA